MHSPVKFAGLGALVLLAGTAFSTGASAQVTYDRLLNPEPENWLMNNRTYDAHRYAPLDEINTGNVAGLKMVFAVPLIPRPVPGFGGGLQATPVVDNGIMYMTDATGALYRIDVSSGDHGYINWIMDPETDPETDGIVNNRGAALWGDGVFTITRDGYLTFTNAATGEVQWDVATERDPEGDDYFTLAPMALDDRIVFGPAADAPNRGWIEARSTTDGSEIWHFWVIPGPGEPGGETWPADSDIYLSGCSGLWTTGTFDAESNLIYWGTANPCPFGDPDLRPGDNLYSSALVVLNADTGALEWYFQYTPNEQWDYDEIGSHQLINDDSGRAVIQHFGRNGFNYILDAATGEFINGVQYVDELDWTAGLDPKTGMPVEYDPALRDSGIQRYALGAYAGETQVARFCPAIQGGVNFQPTSYSERTGLVYGSSLEGCTLDQGLDPDQTGATVGSNAAGEIVIKTRTPYTQYGGTLATAGGLVFSSQANGDFFAIDDTSGEILWSVNVGSQIDAPPMSYAVDGKQYIAIPVGTSGVNNFFPGGGYISRADDPNAASVVNQQRTWTVYIFAL
ncbi:MAG: PQQ-binding-like beta-propeller repeat protein [Bauldia sp.]|nr:PQQ-binding-like beta-propeller repeat protein [Bauldia sp.]